MFNASLFPELIDKVSRQLFGEEGSTNSVKPSKLIIGYSGGLDSTVLLHAVIAACKKRTFSLDNIKAIHCHHGISSNADSWLQHCQKNARHMGIRLESHYLELEGNHSEKNARDARYKVFAQYMDEGSILLLGHHADDQVETMLFRFFRGSGVKGLSGIPAQRIFEKGKIIRPLLDVSRDSLERIATDLSLSWVEDESNQTDAYDRNFLRKNVLPLINKRWPQLKQNLLQTAQIMSDSESLLFEYADELIQRLDFKREAFGFSIDIGLLGELTDQQRNLVLRHLVFKLGKSELNTGDLEQIKNQFFYSQKDAQPVFDIQDLTLRRFRSRLYFLKGLPSKAALALAERIIWNTHEPLVIRSLGSLSLIEGGHTDFYISFRGGGERLKPVSRNHSQSLKKLLQESDVEPWLRSLLPIIYLENEIVAVADVLFCSEHRFKWSWF